MGHARVTRERYLALFFVQLLVVSLLTPMTFAGSVAATSANDIGYHFDESSGTTVTDRINSNDGTTSGSPGFGATGWTNTTGDWGNGNALDFGASGGNDGDEQATAPIDLENHNHMTVAAWIKTSDESTYGGAIFSQRRARDCPLASCGGEGWVLWLSDGNNGETTEELIGVIDDGNGPTKVETGETLADGTWHHVAMTYDGSSITVYVNGTQVGSKAYTGDIKTRDNGNFDDTYIGVIDGAQRDEFDGLIDEPVILPRALDGSEIEYLNDTNRIDETGPTFDSATKNTDTKIDVTIGDDFDIDESSIQKSDFSVDSGASISSISTAETGSDTSVTLTLDSAVDDDNIDVTLAGSISDNAGHTVSSGTKTATDMDGVAPTIDAATKNTDTKIDVDLSDGGAGFNASTIEKGDFSLDTGTISSIDTTGISDGDTGTQTVTLTLDSAVDDDTVTVSLQSDGIDDMNGNTQTSGSADAPNMDGVAPTLDGASKNTDTKIDVDLSDGGAGFNVSTIEKGDFSLDTGTISSIDTSSISDGDTGTQTVTLTLDSAVDDDTVTVSLQSDGIDDMNGNTQTSGSADATNMDGVAPTLDGASKVDDTTIDADLSESGAGFDASTIEKGDFSLDTGTISSIDTSSVSDDDTGTQTVTLTLDSTVDTDTVTVTLQSDGIDDMNGNTRSSGSVDVSGMDGVAPSISDFSATNPSGQDVQISFDSDEQLSSIDVSISNEESASLTESDFSESSSGGTYTYEYTYSGSSDGTYDVSLDTATDSAGNDGGGDSDSVSISTFSDTSSPTASFDDGDRTVDNGTAVRFDGSSSSDDNSITGYDWDVDDDGSFEASGSSATHTYHEPGTYTVTLKVTDEVGKTGTTTVEVTVEAVAPTADAGADTNATVGAPITLNASNSTDSDGSIASYEWDVGDDGTVDATGATTNHTFDSAGSHVVNLTVTDDDDATDSDTLAVNVTSGEPPTADAGADTNAAVGATVTLNASNSTDGDGAIASYEWDVGDDGTIDATGPNANHTVASQGLTVVNLTVTDASGQTDSDLLNVSVSLTDASGNATLVEGVPATELNPTWPRGTSNVGLFTDTGPTTRPDTAWSETFDSGLRVNAAPLAADGMVLVATDPTQSEGEAPLRAYDQATGTLEWELTVEDTGDSQHWHEGAFYRLSYMNGTVYGTTNNNTLYAVDGDDGSVEWSSNWASMRTFSQRENAYIRDVIPYNGTVYTMVNQNGLKAVDADTGETSWEWQADTNSGGSEFQRTRTSLMAISEGVVYLKSGTTLYRVDAANGSELGQFETDKRDLRGSSTVVNGTIYGQQTDVDRSDGYSRTYYVAAYDADTGNVTWRDEVPGYFVGGEGGERSVVYADGTVYVHAVESFDNWDDDEEMSTVIAYNATTGERLWETDTGAGTSSSFFIADGVIYTSIRNNSREYGDDYQTVEGYTTEHIALDAETGETLWTKGGERQTNPPRAYGLTVGSGQLYHIEEPNHNADSQTPTLEALGQSQLSVSTVNVSRAGGTELSLTVETTMQAASLTADIGGVASSELTLANFTEQSVDGGYRYTATYDGEAHGTYNVSVEATGSNDGSDTGSDSVRIRQPTTLAVESDTRTYDTGDDAATLAPGLDVSGSEATTLRRATVKVSTNRTSADRLTFDEGVASRHDLGGNYNPATGTLTVTGEASPSAYQAVLRTVGFETERDRTSAGSSTTDRSSGGASTSDRTVRFTLGESADATDGATDGDTAGTVTVSVVDRDTVAPTASVVGPITTKQGTATVFDASASSDDVGVPNYTWSFGDGTTTVTTGSDALHVYERPGNYTASVTVADAAGNTDTTEVTVTVRNVSLTARTGVDGTTVRAGETVTLDATASTASEGIASYAWDLDDDGETESTRPIQSVSYAQPGSYETTLTVTDDLNNTATTTTTLTVTDSEPPNADAGASRRVVSEGETVRFNASGTTDNGVVESYAWDWTGDGDTDAVGETVGHTFEHPGTYEVTVTVTDAGDNADTDTQTLVVRDETPPDADAGADSRTDQNESVQVSGAASTDNVGIVRYAWDVDGDGASERTGANVSVAFERQGTYPLTVTVTDGANNTDTDTVNVTVADSTPPTPVVTGNRSAVGNSTVLFNASASTDNVGIARYDWDFESDGNFDASGTVVTHEYDAGNHTATLQLVDESGNRATERVNVTIRNASVLVPSASATPSTVDAGESFTLDADASRSSAGIASYEWDTDGDGTTDATGNRTRVNFTSVGERTIRLTVTDRANNTARTTLNVTVRDATPPSAVPASEERTVGQGEPVTFDGHNSTDDVGVVAYRWDVDSDGTTDATGPTPTHTYEEPGTYTATLTVADAANNTAVRSVDVTVRDATPPEVAVESPPSVPQGEQVTLDATGSTDNVGVDSYEWDLDDDGTGNVDAPTATTTFETIGTHEVALTVADASGNTANETVTVNVTDGTAPTADAGSSLTALEGSAIQFDASNSTDNVGIAAYEWDFGDTTSATGEVASHTYDDDGRYTVELTTTDDAGNEATDSLQVTVVNGSVLVADAGGSRIESDQGDAVAFDATTSAGNAALSAYEWDFDGDGTTDATGATPNHTFEEAGVHTVVLTVTDGTGTTATDTVTVDVADTSAPTASAAVGRSTVAEDTSVVLDGTDSTDNTAVAEYRWDLDGDDITEATGATPTHEFAEPGTYTVELTVLDASGNRATDPVTVVVTDETSPTTDVQVVPNDTDATTADGTAQTTNGTTRIVENSSVTFDATDSTDNVGIASYEWDLDGDGTVDATGETATFTYGSGGNYTATLTVTDDAGNEATETVAVTVRNESVLVANAGPDRTVAPGTQVAFDATASTASAGIASYEWTFGDGTADSGPVAQYAYLEEGTYEATLTVTDGDGDTATDTATVTVADVTDPSAEMDDDRTVSVDERAVLNASESSDDTGVANYTWAMGDGNELTTDRPTMTYRYGAAGTYPVTLTVTDTSGNTDTAVTVVTATDGNASEDTVVVATGEQSDANATDGDDTADNDTDGAGPLSITVEAVDDTGGATVDDTDDNDTATTASPERRQVSVANAPNRSSLSFGLSGASDDTSGADGENATGTVVMDRLDMDIEEGGDFDLNVTTETVALERTDDGAPGAANGTDNRTAEVDLRVDALSQTGAEFANETGARPVGHIEINHSISDSDIDGVTQHFRVRKSYLNDTGVSADAVTLYRAHDGEQVPLNTTRVGESDDFYHFEAESPGLSVFTIGAETAVFDLRNARTNGTARAGQQATVLVDAANVGTASGTYTARLRVDGEVVETKRVTVGAGNTSTVRFEYAFPSAGNYTVVVAGERLRALEVQPERPQQTERPQAQTTTQQQSQQESSPSVPWSLVGGVLVVVLLAGLLWRRREQATTAADRTDPADTDTEATDSDDRR